MPCRKVAPLGEKGDATPGRRSKIRLVSAQRRRYSWTMSNHIYKKIELVGSSAEGIEDAVKNALAKASGSLRNLRWFEIVETRGHIEDGKIGHWQVTIKVGFTLDG